MREIKIKTSSITNRDDLAVDLYLKSIQHYDLITPEQEVQYIVRARNGDISALERMATANLRFVVSIAKQYQYQGLPLIDLINEGNLGLLKAIPKFDETRGFKFISYAVWWIRQSILLALSEYARTVRLPSNQIGLLSKINSAMIRMSHEYERNLTDEELAQLLDMPIEKVQVALESKSITISMDAPFTGDENASSLSDVLYDADAIPDDAALHAEQYRPGAIQELLAQELSEKLYTVIIHFYGLAGEIPKTDSAIAKILNCTQARVWQMRTKALNHLKRNPKILQALKMHA